MTVFLAVTGLSLSAQEKPDSTAYRFRFVAENDMFFSPWSGNGQELERLLAAIDEHRPAIEAGQMYLLVTSYATDGNEEQTAAQVAKTRRNRVKSELIVRGKIKESNFVTDQLFDEAYTDGNGKSLHNMVIVTLPASVEKVAGRKPPPEWKPITKRCLARRSANVWQRKSRQKRNRLPRKRQNRSVSLQSRQPERKPRRNGWSVNAWQRNKSKKSVWKRRNKPACKLKKRQ